MNDPERTTVRDFLKQLAHSADDRMKAVAALMLERPIAENGVPSGAPLAPEQRSSVLAWMKRAAEADSAGQRALVTEALACARTRY